MNLIKIVIYSTDMGKEPFSDWETGLDKKMRAIVMKRLDRIKLSNFGDAKRIQSGNGIWELRIDHGPGYRIYFGKEENTVIILLTGGSKKSQTRDIAKAKQYWLKYKELL